MHRTIPPLAAIALLLAFPVAVVAERPRFPAPGSLERQAICNGARDYVIEQYSTSKPPPKPFLFKISSLKAHGFYASMYATAVYKDGRPVNGDFLPDMAFYLCLQNVDGEWQVVGDLSRGDVPDAEQLREIRRKLPADFPLGLLDEFWQKALRPKR